MTVPRSAVDKRLLRWALAASVLMHAGAVGALWAVPVGMSRDGSAPHRLSGGQTLRPVQIALVAEPQPRRGPPPRRAATPEPQTESLLESAISKVELRTFRLTPVPWAALPHVSATNPPPPAEEPPASSALAAQQAPASPDVIARQAEEVGPAASGNGSAGGSGPAAGVAGPITGRAGAAGQGQGGLESPGGDPGYGRLQGGGESGGGSDGGGPAGSVAGSAPQAPSAAEIASLPTPEYPPRSRRLGEEGLVLLEVEVLPDGRAGTVRVLRAPDYPRLVDAAIEAVRSAAFRPATTDGRPVRAFVEVPIRFRLD
jgi:protein TonB